MATLLLIRGLPMFSCARNDRGFTVTEMLMVVSMIAVLSVIALPVMKDMTASIKLNEAARLVEREMQDARLKAVSSNRVIRVRLNCPATGYIRSVEVLGTAADTAPDRCLTTAYPFPPADDDIMTRPNFDGPVRTLPNGATVTYEILQFSPDGTAANVVSGGVATTITTPVTVTISRDGKSKTVTVNNAGKIQLQ
jgi:prepilin-type N-terminal cleavage/methylation domain-containing protein